MTLAALAAGCHVLGEKPLSDTMAHAKEMCQAAKKAKRLYMVTQNRRYLGNIIAFQQALKKQGGDHIVLICGGVIPAGDYDFLLNNGAAMVFGPGTKVTDAASSIVHILDKRPKK